MTRKNNCDVEFITCTEGEEKTNIELISKYADVVKVKISNHNFSIGDRIRVYGSNVSSYNMYHNITLIIDNNTFRTDVKYVSDTSEHGYIYNTKISKKCVNNKIFKKHSIKTHNIHSLQSGNNFEGYETSLGNIYDLGKLHLYSLFTQNIINTTIDNRNLKGALSFTTKDYVKYEIIPNKYTEITETFVFIPLWTEVVASEKPSEMVYIGNSPDIAYRLSEIFPDEYKTYLSNISTEDGKKALSMELCSYYSVFNCLDIQYDCNVANAFGEATGDCTDFSLYMFTLYSLRKEPIPQPDGYRTEYPRCPYWNDTNFKYRQVVPMEILDKKPEKKERFNSYSYSDTIYTYGYGKHVDVYNPEFIINDEFISTMKPMRIVLEDNGPSAITLDDNTDYTVEQFLRIFYDIDFTCHTTCDQYDYSIITDRLFLFEVLQNGASSFPDFNKKFNEKIQDYIDTTNDKKYTYVGGSKEQLDLPRMYHGGPTFNKNCYTDHELNEIKSPIFGVCGRYQLILGGDSAHKKENPDEALYASRARTINTVIRNFKRYTEYVDFKEWDSLDDKTHMFYTDVNMKYGVNKHTINGRQITIGSPQLISVLKSKETVSSILDSDWDNLHTDTYNDICLGVYSSSVSLPLLHLKIDGLHSRQIEIYKENLLIGPQYTEVFKPFIFTESNKGYDIKNDSTFRSNYDSNTDTTSQPYLADLDYDKNTTKLLNTEGMRLSPQKINGWGDGDYLLYCVEHEPVKTEVYTDIFNLNDEKLINENGEEYQTFNTSDDKRCRLYYKEQSLLDFNRFAGDIVIIDSPRLTRIKQALTRLVYEPGPFKSFSGFKISNDYEFGYGYTLKNYFIFINGVSIIDGDNSILKTTLALNKDFYDKQFFFGFKDIKNHGQQYYYHYYRNILDSFSISPYNQLYYIGFPSVPSIFNVYSNDYSFINKRDGNGNIIDNTKNVKKVFSDRYNYLLNSNMFDETLVNNDPELYISFSNIPYKPVIDFDDIGEEFVKTTRAALYYGFNYVVGAGGIGDFIDIHDIINANGTYFIGNKVNNSMSDGLSIKNKELRDKKLVFLRKNETESNGQKNVNYISSDITNIYTYKSIEKKSPEYNENSLYNSKVVTDYTNTIFHNFNYNSYFSGCILDKNKDIKNFASLNYISDATNDNRFQNFSGYGFNGDSQGTSLPNADSYLNFSITENNINFDAIKNEDDCKIEDYISNAKAFVTTRSAVNYDASFVSNDKARSIYINGHYYDKIFRAIVVFDGPNPDTYKNIFSEYISQIGDNPPEFDSSFTLKDKHLQEKFSVTPSKNAEKIMFDLGPVKYDSDSNKWKGQFVSAPYSYFISSNIHNNYQDYYNSYQGRVIQAGKFDSSNKTFRGLDQIALLSMPNLVLKYSHVDENILVGDVDEFEFDNYFFKHNIELSINDNGTPTLLSNSIYTNDITSDPIINSECHAARFGFNFEIEWPFIVYNGSDCNSSKKISYRSYNVNVKKLFNGDYEDVDPNGYTTTECFSLKVENYKSRLLLVPEALFNGKYDCIMTRLQSIKADILAAASLRVDEDDEYNERIVQVRGQHCSVTDGFPLTSDPFFDLTSPINLSPEINESKFIDTNGTDILSYRKELKNSIRFTECKNANANVN